MVRIFAVTLLVLPIVNTAWAAEQQLEASESGITAQARRTYSLDTKPVINRLDFDFAAGESSGWLNIDGDFHVTGWVQHRSLLCATYRTALRFGVGAPGCLNVEWMSDPIYVTSQYQCNGARVQHDGGDSAPEIGAQIGKITCAERVIRCSGSCK